MPLPVGHIQPEKVVGARPVLVCRASCSKTRETDQIGPHRARAIINTRRDIGGIDSEEDPMNLAWFPGNSPSWQRSTRDSFGLRRPSTCLSQNVNLFCSSRRRLLAASESGGASSTCGLIRAPKQRRCDVTDDRPGIRMVEEIHHLHREAQSVLVCARVHVHDQLTLVVR
jgi:hypothetical protein